MSPGASSGDAVIARPSRGTRPRSSARRAPRRTCRHALAPGDRSRRAAPGRGAREANASASNSGWPGGTTTASSPSVTSSVTPPTRVTTEGSPSASASMSATGSPSWCDGRQKMSNAAITGTAAGRKPRNSKRVPSPSRACCSRSSASSGPRPTATKRAFGNAVDDRARCFEQVGIALGGAQVRDRTDEDLVVAHAESGPLGPGIAAGPPDGRGVDPVADDPRPAADASRERLLDGGRHGEVHLGPARGEPVGEAGQPGVARPDVVLGDHYAWSPGGRQRAHRQSGTDGHERRMHVDEVEVVRADHSAQPHDPPRIPGGGRAEAPDRVAAFGLQPGQRAPTLPGRR